MKVRIAVAATPDGEWACSPIYHDESPVEALEAGMVFGSGDGSLSRRCRVSVVEADVPTAIETVGGNAESQQETT